MRKTLTISLGVSLVVLGVVIAPLPGPGGLPVILLGTVVLLRSSAGMKRRWVRARRRWPGALTALDNVVRRRKQPSRQVARRAEGA
ncbi:MAG: hypothetical protein HY985_16380 [Magnetospirillum sp.]|nr:hypothetical protein [Magnetospirillum sp.]